MREIEMKNLYISPNLAAVFLSIIPGLGHIYKGRVTVGFLLLLIGIPLAAIVGAMLIVPTAGISLLFPLFFWLWVMIEVYSINDRPQFRERLLNKLHLRSF